MWNDSRGHKYNAKRTVVDGITFDSKMESKRYVELKILQKAEEISKLELQPKYVLQEAYVNGDGKKIRAMNYVADFRYVDKNGSTVVEDVKGKRTADYLLKKKWFERLYYPLTITEITK